MEQGSIKKNLSVKVAGYQSHRDTENPPFGFGKQEIITNQSAYEGAGSAYG